MVPALDLLQLKVLIGDEVQRALLELEPDDALRGVCTREREGDVDEQRRERGVVWRRALVVARAPVAARVGAAVARRARRRVRAARPSQS